MKKRTITFRVELTKPPRATVKEVRQYLLDAICTWKGSLYSGYQEADITEDDLPDPLWELDEESVKVTRIIGGPKPRTLLNYVVKYAGDRRILNPRRK
jgi:hypothetical protein